MLNSHVNILSNTDSVLMPFEKLLTHSSRARWQTRNFDRAFSTPRLPCHPRFRRRAGGSTDRRTTADNANRSDSKAVGRESLFVQLIRKFPQAAAASQTIDGEKQTVEQAKFPPIKLSARGKSGRTSVVSVVFPTARTVGQRVG